MSEFDEWYEENSWDLENYYDAEKSFKAGQQSQQAEIDELQGRIDELKITQNNLELKAEDAECVSMSLDDQGVEKCDDDGKSYSLWGRVCQFKKSNNITERDLERIYWEFDQERKNSGGERVVFKNTLRSLLNNLKGNKDEN